MCRSRNSHCDGSGWSWSKKARTCINISYHYHAACKSYNNYSKNKAISSALISQLSDLLVMSTLLSTRPSHFPSYMTALLKYLSGHEQSVIFVQAFTLRERKIGMNFNVSKYITLNSIMDIYFLNR